jgi:hypothetical protein
MYVDALLIITRRDRAREGLQQSRRALQAVEVTYAAHCDYQPLLVVGQKRGAPVDPDMPPPGRPRAPHPVSLYDLPHLVHGSIANFLSSKGILMACEAMRGKEKLYKESLTSLRLVKVSRQDEKDRPMKWMKECKALGRLMPSLPKLTSLTVPINTVSSLSSVLGMMKGQNAISSLAITHFLGGCGSAEMRHLTELKCAMGMGYLPVLKKLDLSSFNADPRSHIFQVLSDPTVCPELESICLTGIYMEETRNALVECVVQRWSGNGGVKPLLELQLFEISQTTVDALTMIINQDYLPSLQVIKVTGEKHAPHQPLISELFVSICNQVTQLQELELDGIIGPLPPDCDVYALFRELYTKVSKGKLGLPFVTMEHGLKENVVLAAMSLRREMDPSILSVVSCATMTRAINQGLIAAGDVVNLIVTGATPEELGALAKALVDRRDFGRHLKKLILRKVTGDELGLRRLVPALKVCSSLQHVELSICNIINVDLDDEFEEDASIVLESRTEGDILTTMSTVQISGATTAYLEEFVELIRQRMPSKLKDVYLLACKREAVLSIGPFLEVLIACEALSILKVRIVRGVKLLASGFLSQILITATPDNVRDLSVLLNALAGSIKRVRIETTTPNTMEPLIGALSHCNQLTEMVVTSRGARVDVKLIGGIPDLSSICVHDQTAEGAFGPVIVSELLDVGGSCEKLQTIELMGPDGGRGPVVADVMWQSLEDNGRRYNLNSLKVLNYGVSKASQGAMMKVLSGDGALKKLNGLALSDHRIKHEMVNALAIGKLCLEELSLRGLNKEGVGALGRLLESDTFGAMENLKTLKVSAGGVLNGWQDMLTRALNNGHQHVPKYVSNLKSIDFR